MPLFDLNLNGCKFLTYYETLFHTTQLLTTLKKKPFENIVDKGENSGNRHFLLFPQCFLPISKRISMFNLHFYLFCHLQNASNLDQSKNLSFGKEFTSIHIVLSTAFGKHC